MLLSVANCFGAGVNMPSSRSCPSPDGRWVVSCVTAQQEDGFIHTILLRRVDSQDEAPIWRATRSCDVLWAGDSASLAITDWTGSNVSEIEIVDLANAKVHALELTNIATLIPKSELEGHCYWEALSWEAGGRLAIRIFGHTDENPSHGFAYYLSVDMKTGVARLVRRDNREPGAR